MLYIWFLDWIYSPLILKFTVSIPFSPTERASLSVPCAVPPLGIYSSSQSTRCARYRYLDYPDKETRAKGDSGLESSPPELSGSVLSTWPNGGTALLFWHEIISDRGFFSPNCLLQVSQDCKALCLFLKPTFLA